jgi:hypothetical protein
MKQEEKTDHSSNLNTVDSRLYFNPDLEKNSIVFYVNNDGQNEILKLCANGDIFVKGRLVENDLEVVEGLRKFLNGL